MVNEKIHVSTAVATLTTIWGLRRACAHSLPKWGGMSASTSGQCRGMLLLSLLFLKHSAFSATASNSSSQKKVFSLMMKMSANIAVNCTVFRHSLLFREHQNLRWLASSMPTLKCRRSQIAGNWRGLASTETLLAAMRPYTSSAPPLHAEGPRGLVGIDFVFKLAQDQLAAGVLVAYSKPDHLVYPEMEVCFPVAHTEC
jgi:hypothetical protein